jgi:hypothetical protein
MEMPLGEQLLNANASSMIGCDIASGTEIWRLALQWKSTHTESYVH